MNKNNTFNGLLLCLLSTSCLGSTSNWQSMQQRYHALLDTISSRKSRFSDNELCHPYWQKTRLNIQKLVRGPYNPNFLNAHEIQGTMVRLGMAIGQTYEVCLLKDCLKDSTKAKLAQFQDTQFGNLPRECTDFNCSTNTLGHLFYAARTIELMDKAPKTIMEFGGGYGNLARIYHHFFPECTYFIIDLPELLALQYFFLKETAPDKNVILHANIPEYFEQNAIHLIAVNYLHDLDVTVDLFVSTFALSEASDISQDIISNKKFFGAPMTYITGQLNGWGSNMNFIHHNKIHANLRQHYTYVDCHPFHLILGNLKSYEVIAKNLNA